MTRQEYLEKELHKMHFDFVGEKFNDKFKYKATDGNGGIYEDTIKAMTFKHAAMYLQKTYHSVLSLERVY
jgi:ribosomal protein L13